MHKQLMTAVGICTLAGTIFLGMTQAHAAIGHGTMPQTIVQSNVHLVNGSWHNAYGNNDVCRGIWNGHAWSGSWNGNVWSGSWNGHAWNGSWNGRAWSGRSWDGHVWKGYPGNGAWNGTWYGHTMNGHVCSVNWNN